jgi:hypothetical protein
VDGDGKKELVSVPIVGRGAKAAQFDQAPARLVLYHIPEGGPSEPWPKEIIDETLHVTHGIAVLDFDGDGRDELLTASFEGVYLFDLRGNGRSSQWRKTKLCAGNQEGKRARGSSEVCVGELRGGKRFIATIDPWHGNEVVVYLPPSIKKTEEPWERHVLDDSLSQGHAVCCADFNGDGSDEILAGFRGRGGGICVYCCTDECGTRWEKSVLDEGGVAAQGFFAFDFGLSDPSGKGDGLPDFVVTGGASHNVVLFLNVTR